MPRLLLLVAAIVLPLSACVPASGNARPEVIFLNGPREAFVAAAAATVQRVAEGRSDLAFAVTGSTVARFLETSRSIAGRRAPVAAAAVARDLGAAGVVLIGVPLRERVVESFADRGVRSVEVTVGLEALIVSASGEILARVESRSYSALRREPIDPPLVKIEDDPTVEALVVVAAEDAAAAILEAATVLAFGTP